MNKPVPSTFAIGSEQWPGLAKLSEECGEVVQVVGKLVQTGGAVEHWDGTNLRVRLIEEMADVFAAIAYVMEHSNNHFDQQERDAFFNHSERKKKLFDKWDLEARCEQRTRQTEP